MRRLVVALAAGVATLAAAWAAAPGLGRLAATATLVPPDDPTVVLDREVTEEFGFENPVVWLLEARSGTIWTRPMLQRLAALTDDVRRIPGVVAFDVIGLASPNMRDLRVTEQGLEPTYLMGEVPAAPEAIAALRRRIDGDPSYAGTLVTRDGRAAMVVANFRRDADPHAVGAAALALRDRYRDAETAAWAVGAPVFATSAPAALAAVAPRAAAYTVAALGIAGLALGARACCGALLAAVLGAVWMAVGAVLGSGTMPWALEAIVPTALVAAAVAAGAERAGMLAAAVAAGMLPGALGAGPPARALWIAAAAGALPAMVAGRLAREVLWPVVRPLAAARAWSRVAVGLAALALLGAPWLRCSLSLVGYGGRYLPVAAAADVGALRRLFPPPVSLAVRARGEPGFVGAPAALQALDAAAAAARADPAVRRAMSIADVVKMVHRAFNDDRAERFTIPDDPTLAGRYLALAYSPPLRRFLDRAFADTALWVEVGSERPADLERVVARLRAALAGQPVPGAKVDLPAGDGAVLLVMARVARRVAGFALVGLLVVAGVAGAAGGWRAAIRALGAGAVAVGVGAGVLGWTGTAVDLVSLPLLAGAAVATAALGGVAPPPGRFGLGLVGAGALALVAPLPAAALVAALLLGPGLGVLATTGNPPPG